MAEPIKIVVVAQTEQAAADLQDFVKKSGSDLSANLKKASKASQEVTKHLGNNRMAMMELGHVGRATAEMLAMGVSPMRILALESPRIIQASTTMGFSLAAMLPWVVGIGAAVGAGALAWSAYMSGVEDTTKKNEELVASLEKVPGILEKISQLTKAGLVSGPAANQFADVLNGLRKLYKDAAGQIHEQNSDGSVPTETVTEQNVTQAGMVAFGTAGREVQRPMSLLTDQNEINDYITKKLPQVAEAQTKAANQALEIQKKVETDFLSGIDKEIAALQQRGQVEREQLQLALQQAGNLIGPGQRAKIERDIQESVTRENYAIADLRAKQQEKRVAEQAASEREIRTQEAQRTREALQVVEDNITAMEQQQGVKRGQYAAVEYAMRVNAAQRVYFAGDISEQEYTHLVVEASKQRATGEAAYRNELLKPEHIKQELARSEIEGQLTAVRGNPFLTDSQKRNQSLPLEKELFTQNQIRIARLQIFEATTNDDNARLNAQREIIELTRQQADLTNEMAAQQHPWATTLTQLQSQAELTATNVAATFSNVFNAAIASVSAGITGLIMGTKSWSQFLMEIPRQILTEIVGAIVQMGVRWVATQIMMAVVGKSVTASTIAASAPLAALQSAIWATPATLATIATLGAAAVQAPGMIAMAEGLTLATAGFEVGGYTGGREGQIAGVVHGEEFVFSAGATRAIGRDTLEAMHNRASTGGGSSSGGGSIGGDTKVINVFDRSAFLEELKKADYAHVIVNHVMANKTRLGILT